MKNVDYIIIGQGLAGTILAYMFIKAGKTIHIINQEKINTSSKVAAGLYNPITGRKMVKTWKADEIFPGIEPFYKELEKWTGKSFLHPIKVYRPFLDISEQNEWQTRATDPSFSPYIESVTYSSAIKNIHDNLGGVTLRPSGYVDINSLIGACKKKFESLDFQSDGTFEQDSLEMHENSLSYRGIKASKIVFCTGIESVGYFDWLPFKLVKGEILKIKGDLQLNAILNRGIFMIPQPDGTIKIGATYDWNDLSETVTSEAREFLLTKFHQLANAEILVVKQYAGIRPTTRDRRPFIGIHPKFPALCTFNGFGSKGVSLIPYCANHFHRHLEQNETLDSELNINRYYSLY